MSNAVSNFAPEGVETMPHVDYFSDIFREIEGTWWKFDIADFGMPREINDLFDCTINTLVSLNTDSTKDELIKLYKDWPLLDTVKTSAKDGNYVGYEVNLNTANMAGFFNNFRGTGLYGDFKRCAETTYGNIGDYGNLRASDFESSEPLPTITLFIHPWSYKLHSMKTNYAGDGFGMSGEVIFEFVDSVNISAPENAKPVMEMVGSVMMKACNLFVAGGGSLAEEECLTGLMTMLTDMQGRKISADIQRKMDLARILTAITDFQTNNSGLLPFGDQATINVLVNRYIDSTCTGSSDGIFTCTGDQFRDPDGTVYSFRPVTVIDGVAGINSATINHAIYYAVGYMCGIVEGFGATIAGSNDRQVALFMVQNGGYVTCMSNS
jgi:hypothetical protein